METAAKAAGKSNHRDTEGTERVKRAALSVLSVSPWFYCALLRASLPHSLIVHSAAEARKAARPGGRFGPPDDAAILRRQCPARNTAGAETALRQPAALA